MAASLKSARLDDPHPGSRAAVPAATKEFRSFADRLAKLMAVLSDKPQEGLR
ncbi:hypothetical protein J0X15_08230 [Roseibium sp. CAU 1637]|uniref:Uncharacterized protein n=1 Tax=Roseibium limicola TaxID=2816037 RepID=A0A939J8T5_9HYPH|nr:hypothetical protein [Roseibium limicola]MBO0345204.1 hypothetical protein [Roseibium limicola]